MARAWLHNQWLRNHRPAIPEEGAVEPTVRSTTRTSSAWAPRYGGPSRHAVDAESAEETAKQQTAALTLHCSLHHGVAHKPREESDLRGGEGGRGGHEWDENKRSMQGLQAAGNDG